MSSGLAPIDTSQLSVGQAFAISWTHDDMPVGGSVGTHQGQSSIRILNESGVGFKVNLGGGHSDHVAAGGWPVYQLTPGIISLPCVVEYVLSGPSPNLILATIYGPGEPVPDQPALGNSPVGVSGSVTTVANAANSIKNDGNAPATSTYETTPSDQASSAISDSNDGSGFRKILSAGTLRTIWNIVRGNATNGKATVDIGDAGDLSITTFHGTLDTNMVIPASQISGGLATGGGAFGNNDVYGFPNQNAGGTQHWRATTTFSGVGPGTYNHNFGSLTGSQTPNFVAITANEGNSTQTVGVDSLGSSSVHVNMPNSWPFYGFAART